MSAARPVSPRLLGPLHTSRGRKIGIAVSASCRAGTCGTCATKVLDGTPDHRDSALTPEEGAQAGLMCVCVFRAVTPRLALDL